MQLETDDEKMRCGMESIHGHDLPWHGQGMAGKVKEAALLDRILKQANRANPVDDQERSRHPALLQASRKKRDARRCRSG